MPYYNRYYRRPYRRWRYRWRRPRRTFRRRYYRRFWVRNRNRGRYRNRKLKKLSIKQYQPKTIHKSKIKGLECFFQCNYQKLSFNFQLYESSYVPEHLPGGGGFSIKAYSLQYLYDSHDFCRNFWTKGNANLPLVRYMGCKFTLYQSDSVDYVFTYHNNYPMVANIEMYNATQPSMLMMTKHSIKVPSKKTQRRRKPYKIVRIRPPAQLQNKWYFAQDICNFPLLMTLVSACSFDNYYISTNWDSININIITLKAGLIENTNFKNYDTSGYYLKTLQTGEKVYLYATHSENPVTQLKPKELIFLGNSREFTEGYYFEDPKKPNIPDFTQWDKWKTSTKHWGNPFHPFYITGNIRIFTSTTTVSAMFNKDKDQPITSGVLTEIYTLIETLRYTPNADNGTENSIYFKPNTKDEQDSPHWSPPRKEEFINSGYPLYILCWGFPDFQKRLGKLHNLETDHTLVIQTKHTRPIRQPIIPLSESFIQGHSPFEKEHNNLDNDRWYPQLQYQYEQINEICKCGPGTPKLNGRKTVEAKGLYTFYFKFGGSPPPMSFVDDPETQDKYAIPNNMLQTTSLQSPTTPLQTFLYHFDTKRDYLTSTAAKRLQKDWDTKRLLFTDGTAQTSSTVEVVSKETQEETTKEEKEEEILQLLDQQHLQQRELRHRIKQLIKQMYPIEF
nr:MAG: ORF1 [TTV-like mini virus]